MFLQQSSLKKKEKNYSNYLSGDEDITFMTKTPVTTIILNAVLDLGLLPLYIHPISLLLAVLPPPEELAVVMVERFKTYFILIVILIR